MFLNKCGRFFFQKMRPLFFFIFLVLPLIGAGLFSFCQNTKLSLLEERFYSSLKKEKLALDRKKRKERFLSRYSNPPPFFLDQNIESFPLLEKEKKRLIALQSHPAYPESGLIQERLAFLNANQLAFVEEKMTSNREMKETEERSRFPVQMDENDLGNLLSLIEDIPKERSSENNRPQLLIRDFRLRKVYTPLQTQSFEVKMDLIKREFTP